MTVFALYFDRPDKRAPLISYHTSQHDCDRTIQSIIHLTARDYGSQVRLLPPTFGFRRNLARLIEATGEDRLHAEIRVFESVPEGSRLSPTARRIICWERATPAMVEHWNTATRLRPWEQKGHAKPKRELVSKQGMSGAEKFAARRAEAEAGLYKKL